MRSTGFVNLIRSRDTFTSLAQRGQVRLATDSFTEAYAKIIAQKSTDTKKTANTPKEDDAFSKIRTALDLAIPDEPRPQYCDESVDDFHPLIIKKLLGIEEERPNEVLDSVTQGRLRARMSKPFEAALRHFKAEESEQIYATAVFSFLQTRLFLKEMWKPFPGDYWRVLSLVPSHATSSLKAIYDAMLEDYHSNVNSGSVEKTPKDFVAPGGGHPHFQEKLIKDFEKQHASMLIRIEQRNQDKVAARQFKFLRRRELSPIITPLDMDDINSIIFKLISARRSGSYALVPTLFNRFNELLSTNKSEYEARANTLGMGKAARSAAYSKALISLHGVEKAFEMVRGDSRVNTLSAGMIFLRHNREYGLECLAIWRSRHPDVRKVLPSSVLSSWAITTIEENHSRFTHVLRIIIKTIASDIPTGPYYLRNALIIYKLFLYFDSSYKATSNSFRTERGRLLARAAETPKHNWSIALPAPLPTRKISRIFGTELKCLRDIPHPFTGIISDLGIKSLVPKLMKGGSSVLIVDTNVCEAVMTNPLKYLKEVAAHAASLNGGKLKRYKIVFPWSVLIEMDAGFKAHKRGRYHIHRSFSVHSKYFITLRANVDALCVGYTPLAHLHGADTLGPRDRHIANLAIAFDFVIRTTRAEDAGKLQDLSLVDEDDDVNSRPAGNDPSSQRASRPDGTQSLSLLNEYWQMQIQRCLNNQHHSESHEPDTNSFYGLPKRSFKTPSPFLFSPDELSEVVVATEDIELRRYLQSAGIVTFPPKVEAGAQKGDANVDIAKPTSSDDDDDDNGEVDGKDGVAGRAIKDADESPELDDEQAEE